MDKKTCIITGANAGIGRQAAIQVAGEGYHVILACRNRERGQQTLDEIKELDSNSSVELQIVDLGLRDSILKFVKSFKSKNKRLDVLIHNAAIFNVTQKQREENIEGIETVWAANHLGPVYMTELLLDMLEQSENGRILTITSKGLLAKPFLKVDLHDPEFKEKKFSIVNAYYQSKIAQLMYTYWLAERLKNTKITVNSIRVTAVKIDLARHPELSSFMKWVYSVKAKKSITPETMARTYTHFAVSNSVANISGKYFDEHNQEVDSNTYSKDKDKIYSLMELTSDYVPEIKKAL
ncbi:MAG: SDR family NAD(P)-dependent oxidoreductase [Leptospirales bacterium]